MTFQAGNKIDQKEAEEKERDADGSGEKVIPRVASTVRWQEKKLKVYVQSICLSSS